MTEQELSLLKAILAELKAINSKLDAKDNLPYTFLLSEFKDFDFSRIGAEVVTRDQDGAVIIRWRNQLYGRRSPQNKYGKAIWYSRKIDTDTYEKLIRFVQLPQLDPIPESVKSCLH